MILPLDEIVERLKQVEIRAAARDIGLHENVVYRIAWGKVQNPTLSTVQALSDYLLQRTLPPDTWNRQQAQQPGE